MFFTEVVVNFSLHFSILLLIPAISGRAFPREISDEQAPKYIPCKEDWFFFEEKCYKVGGLNNGLTWEHASIYCKQEQGDLVTIQSKDLQDFLVTFLLLEVKSSVWIGLNDRLEHSKYQWSDGSPITYLNWNDGQPTGNSNNLDACVKMRYFGTSGKGKWHDFRCDMKLPYICQSGKRKTSRNLDPRFCSNGKVGGWKHLNSCYHFVSERKTWEDAEKHCQNIFKGHLVTIIDEPAKLFIDYMMSNFTDDLWVGIKTTESTPQRWASGWRVVFNRWDTSQAVFEDGLCVVYSYGKLWRTAPCSYVHPFICETSTDKSPVEENWECPSLSDRWINTNGKLCYLLYADKKLKWFEANYECMRKGGALASISSAKEADNLHYVINQNEIVFRMYIGLHSSYTNKSIFEWIDGSEMNYQHWNFGEPNNVNENCGEMFAGGLRWNDINCDTELYFICSAKKVRPEVEENIHEREDPSFTPFTTESYTTDAVDVCTCPICPNITKETDCELTDCVCKVCPNITKETETELTDCVCKENTNVTEKTESEMKEHTFTVPPHITEIIESALKESSCSMNPNIMKLIESALENYSCPSNRCGMDEDMGISNKEDSRTDESNTSTEKMKSDSENEQKEPETTKIFIDTSILTPQDKNEEKLYISPLSGKDSRQDLSQTESALVEPTKVREASVAEQQALILQQRKRELELSMKFKVEEHKLRMSVLNAQLKLLNQISELIVQNPEAINLIIYE